MPNYRQLHEESLKANRPDLHQQLRESGELESHLDEISQTAQSLRERVKSQLAENHPYNPPAWRNSREAWEGWIERTADEIVMNELVLVPDRETEQAQRDGYVD